MGESFNEREHCWTDYESPSSPPGLQQFMNRLLQQIESNTTTNFVLSPHSIHSVFSQLLQGSGGRTKEELESLLGVRASDSLVEQYRILGQGLTGEGFKQANLLAVANS